MIELIHLTKEPLNNFLVFFSFLALIISTAILFHYLIKKLEKKELLFFALGLVISLFLRIIFGLFSPIHPEDHYVEIFLNAIRNIEQGSFFWAPYRYGGGSISAGLYEILQNNFLSLFNSFNIYQIYYLNIFLHLISGILLFLLTLNISKEKFPAFISLFIFSSLPVLIRFSATETIFIVNAISILLFINFIFFIFETKKENSLFYLLVLFFLFSANLINRLDYMPFFIGSFFLLLFTYLKSSSLKIQDLKKYKKIIIFLVLAFLLSIFYLLGYLFFGKGLEIVTNYYILNRSLNQDAFILRNFFSFSSTNKETFAIFFNSFFTPWYFILLFLLSPLILIIKKRYIILLGFIVSFIFAFFLEDLDLSNSIRKLLPLLYLLIACVSYSLYIVCQKLNFTNKYSLIILCFIILILPIQNKEFLQIETARKSEQDFLIYQIENNIPANSLILTIHEKKYEHSKFFKDEIKYKHTVHGNEFPSYLLHLKEIDIMDIYHEYDPEIISSYDNVFYYKGLYRFHEKNQPENYYQHNKEYQAGYQIAEIFEDKHILDLISDKKIENYGFHIRTIDQIKNKTNYSINYDGDIKIGIYKVIFNFENKKN